MFNSRISAESITSIMSILAAARADKPESKSNRLRPHNTRGNRLIRRGKAKRYQRSRVGPPRLGRADGPLSYAVLDRAVTLRLRGEYKSALELLDILSKASPRDIRIAREMKLTLRLYSRSIAILS